MKEYRNGHLEQVFLKSSLTQQKDPVSVVWMAWKPKPEI